MTDKYREALHELEATLTAKDDGCRECRGAPGSHDPGCPLALLHELVEERARAEFVWAWADAEGLEVHARSGRPRNVLGVEYGKPALLIMLESIDADDA